ncbi:PAS domain S-box-containing protein [Mesobacillus persicus]|uniref:histidine kinase n=1 Tax=Mesobacillus persicus TaxID=930146 RepID=A0A1H7VLN8_9BACI|nr:PAS domain S-box protein [Mesobacillus persicus]SEM10212.1 PAS domain S-box-containing protein [Mesobacillus persicus]
MVIFYEKAHYGGPVRTVSIDEMKSMLDLHSFLLGMITRGDSLSQILETLSLTLEEHFKRKMHCSILLAAEENNLTVGSAPNLPNEFSEMLHPVKIGPSEGSCGTAVYRNEPVITIDIEKDPLWDNYRDRVSKFGIKACWSIPISIGDQVMGSFAVYHTEICRPTEYEFEILKTCANLAGFAIERDKRIQLEKQLKESEQRFKSLFDHYPESIHMISLEGDFLGCNDKALSVFGYEPQEFAGKKFHSFVLEENKQVITAFNKAIEGNVHHCQCKTIHKNGNALFINLTFLPILVKDSVVGVYGIARDVTYEKLLEQELSVSHKEIEHILKNHQGMIFKYKKENGQFIHTFGAGQLFDRLGMPLEEFTGKTLADILPADEVARKIVYYEKAWKGLQTSYEASVRDIDYVATLRPIFEEGKVTEVIVSCSDITELKKTHDDLRKTQELMESFVHNTGDAIATMDIEGKLTFANQAYVEMFGYPKGENCIPSIPDNYRNEYRLLLDTVKNGTKVKGHETVRKRLDGDIVPVSVTYAPLKDKNGSFNGFSAIIRDITEQKRIEKELEENKQRYQSLFFSNPDLVYSLDLEGVITNINPSVQRLIGYSPEQIIGENFRLFVNDQSLCHTEARFKETMKGIPQTYETGLFHKNGQTGFFHITNLPIIVNNQIVGVYGIAKDISEIKKAEEYLRKSDRLSAIGQLAAGIAHEIRNPLTSIKGFLQFLQEKSQNQEYFEIMLREIDRIELITNEFLILAKPQAKKYSQTSIKSILHGFLPLVETQANLSNIAIKTEIDELIPAIYCDPNQIKQVFLNIMKNSIESMPEGGKIKIRVMKKDGHIKILIEDSGCGIPPERLKRIGEPFYSTKEKGTGLGLMIIFKIIKEHKGSIQINSELNEGTQVEICIPY